MALSDHLEKLKYFSAIARFGSITLASKKLRISQPSLTHAVKSLEENLGYTLLVRTAKGVLLTEKGARLLELANRISRLVTETENQLAYSTDQGVQSNVKIGTHESISIYFLPFFLRHFSSAYPKIQISLKTGRSSAMVDLLKKGEVDLAISVNPPKTRRIQTVDLFGDQFNFYASPALGESKNLPFILMPDALEMTHEPLGHIFRKHVSTVAPLIECENHETVRALTEEGLGLGLLPDQVAKPALLRGILVKTQFRTLPKNMAPHTIGLSFLKTQTHDKGIEVIAHEMPRHVKLWLRQG